MAESISERVEKRLIEAQSKKEFKDTGIVSYTKKYKRSYEVVSVNDLSELELDAVNAYKQVEKAKVWLPYDLQLEKEKGFSSGATYLKVKCRESLQNRPFDSKDARNVYVVNISKVQTILNNCFSVKEVNDALDLFIRDKDFFIGEIGEVKSWQMYSALNKKKETIFSKRFLNFCSFQSDAAMQDLKDAKLYSAFTNEQQDEFINRQLESTAKYLERRNTDYANEIEKVKDAEYVIYNVSQRFNLNRKDVKGNPEKYAELLLGSYKRAIDKAVNTQQNLIKREGLSPEYSIRNDNWDWAFGEKEKIERKISTAPKINTKPPLSHISRIGGLKIPDIAVESITNEFCFNNVVFGNALKDSFSKESVRHFIGALTDLAEILDIDICAVNQLGKLDINFATMGTGGHMATYFPSYKAINLTKSKGDGSIAHEWFHYLDNVIQEGAVHKASSNFASESSKPSDFGVKLSMYYLKIFIKDGDGENKPTVVRFPAQDKVKYYIYGETVEAAINSIQRSNKAYAYAKNSKQKTVANYYGCIANKFNLPFIDVPMIVLSSIYWDNSKNIGTDYWIENVELFARAWEAYIEKKLTDLGRKNNYLVSYDWAKEYGNKQPYPYGEELNKISVMFDNIISEFKKEFNIAGFKAKTTEREDEYIDFKEVDKKEVKVETENPKQIYLDKIEIYKEMIAEISGNSKKQVYLDKIDIYEEMIKEL